MADFAEMKVDGLDDIEKLMKKLPRSNQKRIKDRALRAGSRDLVLAMREHIDRIPPSRLSESGKRRISKSVGVVRSKTRLFEGKVFVGPRYAGVKHTAPDAHLFEFGTDMRTTESGASRGRIIPTPFVRPAWEAEKVQAVENIRQELVTMTIEEAVKLRKL